MNNHQKTKYKLLRYWPGKRGKNLTFVLLRHSESGRRLHYDLMLELIPNGCSEDRTLWGLECYEIPSIKAKCLTWQTHRMHRRKYLFFEGNIGEGLGKVKRIDKGVYNIKRKGNIFILSIQGTLLRDHFMLLHHGYGIHKWLRLQSNHFVHKKPN